MKSPDNRTKIAADVRMVHESHVNVHIVWTIVMRLQGNALRVRVRVCVRMRACGRCIYKDNINNTAEYTHTLTRTKSHKRAHAHMHMHVHTCTHVHMYMRTRTRTHTR